jgi:hypothetical protein
LLREVAAILGVGATTLCRALREATAGARVGVPKTSPEAAAQLLETAHPGLRPFGVPEPVGFWTQAVADAPAEFDW